jgi:hypothetical protein
VPPTGQGRLDWLKHAFAVDPPGPAKPDEAQARVVDRICKEIVRRRLTTPAMIALEMGRPLNHLSAQVLTFFQPFVTGLGEAAAYGQFTTFLEQRGSLDYIGARIEALEAEYLLKFSDDKSRERRGAKGSPQASGVERVLGPRDKNKNKNKK